MYLLPATSLTLLTNNMLTQLHYIILNHYLIFPFSV